MDLSFITYLSDLTEKYKHFIECDYKLSRWYNIACRRNAVIIIIWKKRQPGFTAKLQILQVLALKLQIDLKVESVMINCINIDWHK